MNYSELFASIKSKAKKGTVSDIDFIMSTLDQADLPITRAVDLYLGLVTNQDGIHHLSSYLFNGTLIQRNYCALFFERRNQWDLINRAFEKGCIDYEQAYAR